MQTNIAIIPAHKIDVQQWNACVAAHENGLIYAQYQYLNTMCDNWCGLVIGNYKAVMPLPWRKKWGIRYLYAVPFMQQLGLIGNNESISLDALLSAINKFAKFGDLFFNFKNEWIAKGISCVEKTNYIIHLQQHYPKIQATYSKDLVQNLQKAKKTNCLYQTMGEITTVIQLFQEQYSNRFQHIKQADYEKIKTVCSDLHTNNQCIVRVVTQNNSQEILAAAILLKDNKRIYLLLNATTKLGRKLSANHLLIDKILEEFSTQPLLFDFEGSNQTGIKNFYENFNPIYQPYFHYKQNPFSGITKRLWEMATLAI